MLEQLQPKEVFYYFEELSKIPHGSGNTKAISDYCVSFAKTHNLHYTQDNFHNVIIKKDATKGREQDPGVILQGHLDMVAVKESSSSHNFQTDPLKLKIDGDFLCAEGTSLGGDDGIAVAYALAVLASDTISHPFLEVILTTDEETGMEGASNIDLSEIKGKYLLNLDSEEEGILLASCAGGLRSDLKLPIRLEQTNGMHYQISFQGLKGGHSGAEIHKERINAIKLGGRLLFDLKEAFDFSIFSMEGGEKDNAIPRNFSVSLLINPDASQAFEAFVKEREAVYQEEYAIADEAFCIQLIAFQEKEQDAFCMIDQEKVIFLLRNIPNGVQHMNLDIPGLVETSLNVGVLRIKDSVLELTASVRSSVKSRKEELSKQLKYIIEFLGGTYSTYGDYPEWEYNRVSDLRNLMQKVYIDLFKTEPQIQAIHAGLECGILLKKCPGIDAVSFGPNMYDIHTPQERLSISSTQRMWDYLVEILKQIS